MYIVEKIVKLYFKYLKKERTLPDYSSIQKEELEDVVSCKHNFMPIDSTGNILACSKCGYVVTRKRLNRNRNFFKYQ